MEDKMNYEKMYWALIDFVHRWFNLTKEELLSYMEVDKEGNDGEEG